MKSITSPRHRPNVFRTLWFALSMVLFTSASYAQSPVDFSGTWQQDTLKSDDFYKRFDVKYIITQTLDELTLKETFSEYNGNEIASRDYSFRLDGKETNLEKEGGTEKELAQWSSDKKIL